jgi:two-component system sensor histidine kinase HydH
MTGALAPARVLVVDDNPALADNLQEILADAGYLVQVATNCRAARAAAAQGYDVALIDLLLPDGDGTALASELKAAAPDAEVVLLTGHASVASAAAAMRAGACAYLVKPCATPELLLTVGQATRQVRLLAEKRELSRRAHVVEKLAAVGTLTAGLSHEIRNPLNAAGLQLAVLERRVGRLAPEVQPALLEPLTLVRDEIRRLDHILEDFLQFARPREFVPKPVDLEALLGSVLDLLATDAERRGVQVERAFAGLPPVAGDEGRLRQVAMNITLNALEASAGGGRIRLEATDDDDGTVTVTFDDSGAGVPAELRDRIFEPFFTTKATGTGLGLPIVHAIVTQHGGTLRVETSPLGGARFVLGLVKAA